MSQKCFFLSGGGDGGDEKREKTEKRLTRAHLFPFAGCTAVNAVQARSVIADRLGTETGRLFDNSGGAL